MKKIALFGLLVLLAATVAAQTPATATAPQTTATTTQAVPDNYVIGTEDVLAISVWKEPEISSSIPVRADGMISVALLGDVQAAGKTPTALAEELTTRLRRFLNEPRVTVIVTTVHSRRAYIMGQVQRQGAILLVSDMTILQAISSAGGLAPFANAKKIYVLRNEDGKQVRIPFNYNDVIRGQHPEQNIVLRPGDTLVVP